ncbi:MAG TPA: hypothetical protein DHW20_01835 [Gemmatimonadetes bacterium]|nr:hypothetical protein [Gemmatimonadota bacterium]
MIMKLSWTIVSGSGEGRDGPIPDAERRIAVILEQAAKTFGGCSSSRGVGSWLDGDGLLVTEPIIRFEIWCDVANSTEEHGTTLDDAKLRLAKFAQYIRFHLMQSEVDIVSPSGRVHAITSDDTWANTFVTPQIELPESPINPGNDGTDLKWDAMTPKEQWDWSMNELDQYVTSLEKTIDNM